MKTENLTYKAVRSDCNVFRSDGDADLFVVKKPFVGHFLDIEINCLLELVIPSRFDFSFQLRMQTKCKYVILLILDLKLSN